MTYTQSHDGGTFEPISINQLQTMYDRARNLQLRFKEANDINGWMRYTAICLRICSMINNKIIETIFNN